MSSEAAAEFARLAGTMEVLCQKVDTALSQVAPDHRRDFAQLFTALTTIQGKPALNASSWSVEKAAADGAAKGIATVVTSLDQAREAMNRVVEDIQAREQKRRQVSRRAKMAIAALLVLVSAVGGFGAGLMVAPALQQEGWLPLTGIPVEQTNLVRWALQFKDYDKRALAEWAVSDDGKWAKRFAEENTFIRKGDCPDRDVRQNKVSCRVWQVR